MRGREGVTPLDMARPTGGGQCARQTSTRAGGAPSTVHGVRGRESATPLGMLRPTVDDGLQRLLTMFGKSPAPRLISVLLKLNKDSNLLKNYNPSPQPQWDFSKRALRNLRKQPSKPNLKKTSFRRLTGYRFCGLTVRWTDSTRCQLISASKGAEREPNP